jgi:uncharacterized protein with HEPN domain
MRDNILLARRFVEGFTPEAFCNDRRTFYAVVRCLEIISEASRRLSPALHERHPQLPWRAIMGSGNVYRHDYDDIDELFVWRTVQNSFEPLLVVVQAELGD